MNDKHYNSAIAVRLRPLVDGRQWSLITTYLSSLSNSQFRTAGYMLGERFMPALSDDDFWALTQVLVDFNAKAFLVTVLKSWVFSASRCVPGSNVPSRSLTPIPPFFSTLQDRVEDQRKTLEVMLPALDSPDIVEQLLRAMLVSSVPLRINAFLHCLTLPTSFLLFKTLREVEDDRALLIRTVSYLMKQGSNLSFNLASLLSSYFGLEEVKGTFSLRIQPFELSRLETDYMAFCQAMSL